MLKYIAWKTYYNIVKFALAHKFTGKNVSLRDDKLIIHGYTESWKNSIKEIIWGRKPQIQSFYGKLAWGGTMDNRKFFLKHADSYIKSVRPKSILELGSGIGINLLALSALNPFIERISGIELTQQGLHVFKQMINDPPIDELVYLTELDPQTIKKRIIVDRFDVRQGDMRNLPWDDKSFDFVFSLWALEQLPRTYNEAFAEAERVCSAHALFMEEFKEAQQNIFQRIHLKNVDYFRASFREVEKSGFKVSRFEPMPIGKVKLNHGSLFCRVV